MVEKNNNIPIILGIVVVLVILGLGAFFVLNNNNAEKDANETQESRDSENLPIDDSRNDDESTNEDLLEGDEEDLSAQPNENDLQDIEGIFSAEVLSGFNGKDGAACYVALEGKVYDVSSSEEWVDGVHVPSNGQANCGEDLTEVIKLSPHGISIINSDEVVEIGLYQN